MEPTRRAAVVAALIGLGLALYRPRGMPELHEGSRGATVWLTGTWNGSSIRPSQGSYDWWNDELLAKTGCNRRSVESTEFLQ